MDPREPKEPRDWRDSSPGRGPDPDDVETRVDLSGLRRLSEDAPPERPARRDDRSLARMAAFTLAAIIFAAAPWFFFTRVLRDDTPADPRAGAAPTKSTSPSPTPTPSPSGTPGTYEIANTDACVRVRAAPGTDQAVLTCLGPGVRVTSDGRIASADNFVWLHVKYRQFDGWSATNYLQKVG